uniref:YncE family protein n=1 Tax=candidate division WOR-3 bacterium TaxID=2052148 RepID=A0A7V3ZXG9_UNCW3
MLKKTIGIVIIATLLSLSSCKKADEYLPELKNYLVIVNTLSETVSFYDMDKDTLYEDILKTGRTPNDLLIIGTTGIIVNSGFQGVPALDIIDLSQMQLLSRKPLPIGSNPYSIAYMNGNYYVTLSANNMVYELNQNFLPVDSFPSGKWPEGIATYNGKIFVASTGFDIQNYTYGDGYVYIIQKNAPGFSIDSIKVGKNPQVLKIRDNKLWVCCTGDYAGNTGAFYILNPATLAIEDSIKVEFYPGDFEVFPEGTLIFTDFMNGIFRLQSNSILDTVMIIYGASRIIKDGRRAIVSIFNASDSNYILFVAPDSNIVYNSINAGLAKGVGPIGVYRE